MKLFTQIAAYLFVAISIFDIPGQPDKVLIQANCDDGQVVRIVLPRADLDKTETADKVAQILQGAKCE